jgi:hypothetical protein
MINRLLNQTEDKKFIEMFENGMKFSDFSFFCTIDYYLNWKKKIGYLSEKGMEEMKEFIDSKNDPDMMSRFSEMKNMFNANYAKIVKSDIEKVYRSWIQKMETSSQLTLRYLILKNNLGDTFDKIFEAQRKNEDYLTFIPEPQNIVIVAGNPSFYFCKKFTSYENFDRNSILNLSGFRLELFIDVPILGINYCSKFNPAYGNYMGKDFYYNFSGKETLNVLLGAYGAEYSLDKFSGSISTKNVQPKTDSDESESESESD